MNATKLVVFAIVVVLTGCVTTGPVNPAVGTWSVETQTGGGGSMSTWIINEDLSGVLRTDQGQEVAMKNTAFADGKLTFDAAFEFQGTEIQLKFVGMITGDEVAGEFQSAYGNASAQGARQ